MKTFFTSFFFLCVSLLLAQAPLFVHSADLSNITDDASIINHPDLNGNPNAKLIISHNWNPNGMGGVSNDNASGLYYSNSSQKWMVYNENETPMIEGSSYNIYIGSETETFIHIASAANVGGLPYHTILDNPALNGNPDAKITISTYYNPNSLRNDKRYGVFYYSEDDNWNIFTEDISDLPLDTAFFVSIEGNIAENYTHQATAANITQNYTEINHPLLNENPNALFVFTHNWGSAQSSSNVIVDFELAAKYTGTHWSIFIEDGVSEFPVNSEFDLLIYDPALGIEDYTIEGLNYYPNPTEGFVIIDATVKINKVTVFDMLGKKVLEQVGEFNSMNLNTSNLSVGNYLAKVESENNTQIIKLIKN